ncbi:MAG: rod shape-determining protein MreC [Chitinophagales bacterium]
MRNLLRFIQRHHAFLIFFILELLCFSLIVRYNSYQRASILNTTSTVVGGVLEQASEVRDFIDLKEVNDSLLSENARIASELATAKMLLTTKVADSIGQMQTLETQKDSTIKDVYKYIGAKVINNSINQVNNFITINKGSKDGIKPEMGVISSNGIVGVVKNVSENYSSVISVLHKNMRVSAKIKQNNFIGSLRWEVLAPQYARLDDIPKHAPVYVGDEVTTSGYSSFFPDNVPIGVVEEWGLPQGSNFYNIRVKLSTDFNSLNYVYVIDYMRRQEQKELEEASTSEDNK